jgi:hypothetical protein
MVEAFDQGLRDLAPLFSQAFDPKTWTELQKLSGKTEDTIRFPDELWTHVIYEFACSDKEKQFNREQLLRSLTPLYLGRVASFVSECADASALQVEERLEALCQVFKHELPYLRERWKSTHRPQEVSS